MADQDSNESSNLVGRDAPPSHYLVKIESYSKLLKASLQKCFSVDFDAGGFKWKLSIYLEGDSRKNVRDHISMYLELMETSSLPTGWEVNVIFNFFIFNQLQGKYFSLQDGRVRFFHAMKIEWGTPNFIDLKTFLNPLKGYLVDDTCIFGAEVFVVKNTFKGARLSMISYPPTDYHTWKVDNFSTLQNERYVSETFGCYKWKVFLYPNGCGEGKNNSISLFLDVTRSSIPPNTKLLTKFTLCVRDQRNKEHMKSQAEYLYTTSNKQVAFGFRIFMSLAKLRDPEQGYLVNESVIIEAEVTLLGLVLTNS